MLKVKVIRPFKRRGEIIMPDSVIEVPDEVLTKMVGFIEVIPFGVTGHPDLQRALGEKMTEIDRLGRPWPRNFFQRMGQADRGCKRGLERRIDAAVLAGDRESLELLINEWREFLFDRRSQQLERA